MRLILLLLFACGGDRALRSTTYRALHILLWHTRWRIGLLGQQGLPSVGPVSRATAGLLDACDLAGRDDPEGRIDRFYLRNGTHMLLAAWDWEVEGAFHDTEGDRLSDHDLVSIVLSWQVTLSDTHTR